ncbi:hypothetical protein [Pseudooceanicola nanhaiensis]|uniref:hypothetical protein n=1 Tax=Pseudooceanicola nanhaiensis TaxID=375761 RepID=UPI0040594290
MTSAPSLEALAKIRNWIGFGKALSASLDDPSRFGFEDRSQMLAHVAKLRGVDPSSLRNPLAAVNWMKRNAPEALEHENPDIPMTGVLTLSQISILSNDLAQSLTPKFFSGEVSRGDLRKALEHVQAAGGGRGVTAHERVKRAQAFEEQVYRFLRKTPAALELGNDVEVVKSPRDSLVPSDFSVLRDGKIVAAIECKAHRSKRHRRYLIEILSMAALRARAYHQAFLIVPDTWEESIAELSELVRDLGLQSVAIAAFSEDAGKYGELYIHRLSGG